MDEKNVEKTAVFVSVLARQNKLFGKDYSFENECLQVHNEYRELHGVSPLKLSKDICKVSQKWAEEIAKNDKMSNSPHQTYGENIYCGWSSDPNAKITGREVVDKWYAQMKDYDFSQEPEVLKAGLFTQLVWKDSKELGIGSARSKTNKLYVVANYNPPGNYGKRFVENVLPPKGEKKNITPPAPKLDHLEPPKESPTKQTPPKDAASRLVSKLAAASISKEDFEEACLEAHNEYRANHGVPPLVLNKKICKYSEEWALILVKKGKMEHRPQNEYGENIFYAWSNDPNHVVTGKDPVDKWYSEIKDHTFGKEPTTLKSGHFTQVIWSDTKEMGVALAKSKDGRTFVVANYFPPGNYIGSFAAKVPPPLK